MKATQTESEFSAREPDEDELWFEFRWCTTGDLDSDMARWALHNPTPEQKESQWDYFQLWCWAHWVYAKTGSRGNLDVVEQNESDIVATSVC